MQKEHLDSSPYNTQNGTLTLRLGELYKDKTTGETKPGSKGTSVKLDDWESLLENQELITKMLKGETPFRK